MPEIFLNERRIILADPTDPDFRTSGLTGIIVTDQLSLTRLILGFLKSDDPALVLTGDQEWLWPAFQSHFLLLPAAGGVVKSSKGFLFIFRKGKWDLPKGKIDKNETPQEAAIREVREETGLKELKITGTLPSTWHIYLSPWDKDQVKWILKETKWFLMFTNGDQELIPEVNEDIEKAVWVKPAELNMILENTYSSLKKIIITICK